MIVAQLSVVLLFYSVLNLLQNDGKTEGIDLSTYAPFVYTPSSPI